MASVDSDLSRGRVADLTRYLLGFEEYQPAIHSVWGDFAILFTYLQDFISAALDY